MTEPIEWVFDKLPPSMARRGGDPASHAFRQNVATFVREVIQNANDQATGNPEVHFRFVELTGSALDDFKTSIAWESLEPHLRAAAESKGGKNLEQFLDELERNKRLVLLHLEDRYTVGLTGDELSGDSHFRALCKDTLYSHKQSHGAGGSYGLGKSVLWAFSGLSTVLFNSNLSEHPPNVESPRLFGRVELPSHAVKESAQAGDYSGTGWFGRRVDAGEGTRAESVWGETAARLTRQQFLGRSEVTGTSLLIVGFRDPTTDDDANPDELAREIRAATVREFWPAIAMPGRPLVVWTATAHGGNPIGDKDLGEVQPFVDCYRGRENDRDTLDEPGDVVVREIPIEVPARRDGVRATRGHVRLCVRLASESSPGPWAGYVAWFRRAGMVIRYWDRRSLAAGARPFHAVLACGEARDPERPTPQDEDVERFLRAAEPPGHDDWMTTASLKAEYKQGYAKALEQLKRRVSEELKALVVPRPRQGAVGPDRLRKRFPIGRQGSPGSAPSLFHFSKLTARFDGARWQFAGVVQPS